MALDKLVLLNSKIISHPFQRGEYIQYDFFNYLEIHQFFLKQKTNKNHTKTVQIYDITHQPQHPNNTIFLINDHLNRIGNNPFIGKQQFFNIDFINVEKLYIQKKAGIVTTCYGNRYEAHKTSVEFPSTYIANIAALAHIHKYMIEGYLINQTQKNTL